MKAVVVFLFVFGSVTVGLFVAVSEGLGPAWVASARLTVLCTLLGGLGGVTYCLRAVYLSRSVRNDWDDRWRAWYVIRPFTSLVVGGISYVFLRAGLLVLDSSHGSDATDLGFLALAFIAGLNVDGILNRLEQVAETTWGIPPSRMSRKTGSGPS
jgi:hypothetical protein